MTSSSVLESSAADGLERDPPPRAAGTRATRRCRRSMANEARLGQVFLNLHHQRRPGHPRGRRRASNEIRVTTRHEAPGRVVVEVRRHRRRHARRACGPRCSRRSSPPSRSASAPGSAWPSASASSPSWAATSSVESRGRPGQRVPRRRCLRPRAPSARDQPTLRARRRRAAPRGRVLVVDDEPMIGAAIQRTLLARPRGGHHDAAPREALGRLRQGERFDVILCDLMMPQMTGMDLHARAAA